MSWHYAYNPYFWPSAGTVFSLLALSAYIWRRRSVPGAIPLMIGCLFAAVLAASSVMEYSAVDLAAKIAWGKFGAIFMLPGVTAVTCFFLEYSWPGRWLTRRNLTLLSIPWLLVLVLILTNDLHHLIWLGYVYDFKVIKLIGPFAWIMIAYALVGLGILNLIALAWLFQHSPQHRWPVVLMLVGQLVGRILFTLVRAEALHFDLPLDVLGMGFEFLMYAIALFGFRILDPIPLARQTAVEQLQAGMLVLDSQGNIASLNPAAEKILGIPAKAVRGKPIEELLPTYPVGPPDGPVEIEMSLWTGQAALDYILTISQLKDWRGLAVGRLLLLRDMTRQKQAQAQILEQQRTLAKLHERENLARELHDSTSQVLGFAGLQLEVVHERILDGQAALATGQAPDAHAYLEEAMKQLERLRNVIEEAHADVREYILNLRSSPPDQHTFFTVLQRYLDGYSQNFGIQTKLSIGPGVEDGMLDPGAQMQLLRIIQEALSNTRKHARASCAQVAFEFENGSVLIQIQDNGQGFDPAHVPSVKEHHFGLSFIRERAEALGGRLQVESSPGTGTRVAVEVPAKPANGKL